MIQELFGQTLRRIGWETDKNKLRSFLQGGADEIIEVEPGGSDTAGHLLHHMKAPVPVVNLIRLAGSGESGDDVV
jgi:hypothetical protein